MGKPVVASNIGWATEVIDDGVDGFLVDPCQHLEYADKIIQFLQNKGLQKELGTEARKKIEQKFSMSVVAQQSLLFYKSLIS
jgi:glycosyltransferase involved in cell wall biosynthesis